LYSIDFGKQIAKKRDNMDRLRALSLIQRIAALKSFSAAGAELGLSSTSVSRIVSDFEDETGVRIFNRSTRSIHATEAGQILIDNAAELLRHYRDTIDLARDTATEPTGILRVTATQTYGAIVLAPVIARFLETYPKMQVQCLFTNRVVDLIGEGVDIAIRITEPKDSRLMARQIGTVEHIACAAPSYLARYGTPAKPEDLSLHNCIVYQSERRRDTNWTFHHPSGRKATIGVKGNIKVNATDAVLALVHDGAGIGLLPDYAVQGAISQGAVQKLFPACSGQSETINAVFPSTAKQPVTQRLFLDYLYVSLN
jgi:DNA-binding transcriptional LysR family regulator